MLATCVEVNVQTDCPTGLLVHASVKSYLKYELVMSINWEEAKLPVRGPIFHVAMFRARPLFW